MQYLRLEVSIDTVETTIGRRKLGCLGHIEGYLEKRLERQLVFGRLEGEGGMNTLQAEKVHLEKAKLAAH